MADSHTRIYLSTARYNLIIPNDADIPGLTGLLGNPQQIDHPGSMPAEAEECMDLARWIVDQWAWSAYGPCLIVFARTGETIGLGGFKDIFVEGMRKVDMGMMFTKPFQGQGSGQEVAIALLNKGFAVHKFTEVVANTTLNNKAALHLLRRLEFEHVGPVTYLSAKKLHVNSNCWQMTGERWRARAN